MASVEAQRCFAEGYLLGMALDASEQALEDGDEGLHPTTWQLSAHAPIFGTNPWRRVTESRKHVSNLPAQDFLFDMHRWAYVGLLQMGLLCAVLMNNKGDPRKRQLMHERGPVLLHPKFLSKAKEVLRLAVTEKMVRERLIKEWKVERCGKMWKDVERCGKMWKVGICILVLLVEPLWF